MRAIFFDAGFAFVTSYEALEKNGYTDEILHAIAMWENARMSGIFTDEQKLLLEDVNNGFKLTKSDDDAYQLSRIHTYRLSHEFRQRQPGEAVTSAIEFENPAKEQVMEFILTAKKGTIINPELEINGSRLMTIPIKLEEGEHLKFTEGFANVYSAHWQLLKSISLDKDLLRVQTGAHTIEASCNFKDNEGEMLLELRFAGETYYIN